VYIQTNLATSNQAVVGAQQTDPNLINPWGFSFSTTSPLWVSDQATGKATVYRLKDNISSPTLLTVGVQNLNSAPPSGPNGSNGPTGQVSTSAPGVTTGRRIFR
jgi:hypothetical protein